MKTTRQGRPFCRLTDQSSGLSFELNPEMYDVLERACREKLTCTIELNFLMGSVASTHVRQSGALWVQRPERKARKSESYEEQGIAAAPV